MSNDWCSTRLDVPLGDRFSRLLVSEVNLKFCVQVYDDELTDITEMTLKLLMLTYFIFTFFKFFLTFVFNTSTGQSLLHKYLNSKSVISFEFNIEKENMLTFISPETRKCQKVHYVHVFTCEFARDLQVCVDYVCVLIYRRNSLPKDPMDPILSTRDLRRRSPARSRWRRH